eukprot:2426003-Pyramimonas_sp.AAC.2
MDVATVSQAALTLVGTTHPHVTHRDLGSGAVERSSKVRRSSKVERSSKVRRSSKVERSSKGSSGGASVRSRSNAT